MPQLVAYLAATRPDGTFVVRHLKHNLETDLKVVNEYKYNNNSQRT